MIYEACDNGQLWVIAAKGLFAPLARSSTECDDVDLTKWEDLTVYKDEEAFNQKCKVLDIQVTKAQERKAVNGVSLGPQWDAKTGAIVDVGRLLNENQIQPEDTYDLLQEEAFDWLAIVCKTYDRLDALRALLIRHKLSKVTVRLEDVNGAGKILAEMQSDKLTSVQKDELRTKLREAHVANRAAYHHHKDAHAMHIATKVNRLIDRALSILSGIQKADYTADILNRRSNRAMRADMVSAADSKIYMTRLELSAGIKAFRSTCSICCGDEQIMSVVLKKLDMVEENTNDFALNFPLVAGQVKRNLELISSQCTCFQCCLLLLDEFVYRENLSARIPTVEYEGANKAYINHQITLAITEQYRYSWRSWSAHLNQRIGAKKNGEDPEVMQRRQLMESMLRNFLNNCLTRETFGETGPWVKFPKALV